MAELNTSGKVQPRVDLTAMVDLAFLLITFFMLTTSLSKPHAMDVAMSDKTAGVHMELSDERTVTILLGSNGQMVWYWGLDENPIEGPVAVGKGRNSLRDLLLSKKEEIPRRSVDKKGLMVIVKPGNESSYSTLVDVLDELKIVDVRQYMIADINDMEQAMLRSKL
ncbi:ExbD/TolR family protein [Olivibacter sitiensis]|uniref:ExbD/TolR family protein n=1 Tax=Olivibacter sitiensis TaxID=376470 RepID=UPI00041E64CA|nr:biopolymer transporter ExbD [Olivibacter sitiensis]